MGRLIGVRMSVKRVKQFSELSERERFNLRKRLLKRSYKEGRWLLDNVRCVKTSKKELCKECGCFK